MLAAAERGLINDCILKKANVNYQDKYGVSYHLIIMNDCILVIDSFVVINLIITSLYISFSLLIV